MYAATRSRSACCAILVHAVSYGLCTDTQFEARLERCSSRTRIYEDNFLPRISSKRVQLMFVIRVSLKREDCVNRIDDSW